MIEIRDFFTPDPMLKIIAIISRLAKYVITQVYALREQKVMMTSNANSS